jgi:uncharacterized delta-60 repeat protein
MPFGVVVFVSTALVVAAVASAQSLDTSFTASPSGPVNALRVQPDGKILVGGAFGNWNNLGGTPRGIARLNPDGSLDKNFYQGQETDAPVRAIALQANGQIVVGGEFFKVRSGPTGTVFRRQIARLNADGTLDMTFDPNAAGRVYALAVQADGKILVGGDVMWQLGGKGRQAFGRLNPDGSLDTDFKADGGEHSSVHAIAVQPDGKIVIGGVFFSFGGFLRSNLVRVNPDGKVDATFNAELFAGPYGRTKVTAIAVQADGKILVGGDFTQARGNSADVVTRHNLARFNADGTLDAGFDPGTANPSPSGYPPVQTIVVQPDGRILVGGDFTRLGGGTGTTDRYYIGRLLADGSVDPTFNPGANSYVHALALQPLDGKIVVGGNFGLIGGGGRGFTQRSYLARLNSDGLAQPDTVLDPNFNPGAGPGGAEVVALALQVDGKIVVGGGFSMLGGGGTGTTPRSRIGRLNADGSLDTTFNPGANGNVNALLVQPDGKIVVGGGFSMLGGGGTGTTTRDAIGRLNADGSLETAFNPNRPGGGGNYGVLSLARQSDGKIVAGGSVNWGANVGSTWVDVKWIGRLNTNGTVDMTFAPGADQPVSAVAVQADGKILVGGSFSMLGGGGNGNTQRRCIGRLNPNGTLDTGFNPGANSNVYAIAVQPDGKILVGGNFQTIGGGGIGTGTTPRNFIGRLNTDGSVDTSFNPGANGVVYSIVVQPDGRILVGGNFNKIGGGGTGTTARFHLARLMPDGSVDESFNPGADWNVKAFGVQADGKVVVAGGFTKMGGGGSGDTARSHLARLMFASAPSGYTTNSVSTGATQPVSVQTPAGGVDFTLSPVTTAGNVTVQTQQVTQSSLAQAPPGFKLLLWITFDVKTTAAFGNATFCIPYTLVDVLAARLNEASLRLFHVPDDGSNWVDVTSNLDITNKKVCGSVSHFSTFAIAGYDAVVTRYLAEGATSAFFDTRLALLNPGTTDTTATLTFARSGDTTVVREVAVPARTRVTVDPKAKYPEMAKAEFSTKTESGQLLVVDRTMSWDSRGYGAHAETAVLAPAPTWYLAEGSTISGFNLFYLLQNPNDAEVPVTVRYLRPSGAPLVKRYTLPPNSRSNIWVNEEVFDGLGKALAATDVSAVIDVTNGLAIIVERAMYLDLPGQTFGAGHESAGVTAPATNWFLAEGATGNFFDLFVLIANPNDSDAQVEATYLLPDGTTITRPYTVTANSRFNIWVDLEETRLADTAVSTTISSTNGVPVIVERAMWWSGLPWYEAHNSPGSTTTGTLWALAEGEVGGPRNVETYILLANTSPTDGTVKVTLLFEDGTSAEKTYTVPAKSRFNVPVAGEFSQAGGQRFGALVESLGTTPAQIVVERAMYWSAMGQTWAAGTNALATKIR